MLNIQFNAQCLLPPDRNHARGSNSKRLQAMQLVVQAATPSQPAIMFKKWLAYSGRRFRNDP